MSLGWHVPAALLVCAFLAHAERLTAQGVRDERAKIRSKAMRAQQQFESYRRHQIPVTGGRSSSSGCDVRVGRFCYWHDDGEDPPVEPERVAIARTNLLRALDSLSALAADEWLIGQRVRYLVEADRAGDALVAAKGCVTTAWLCAALTGFAQHALGAYAAADTAFASALDAMPPRQRCRWTDLRDLVPDDFRKEYGALPCERRDSLNARIWWLSDPRWDDHGNDLQSEIYARLTMAHLVKQARSAHDMAWGDDMAELMLRYGWPTAWSRSEPSYADPTRVSVVGHEPSPSFEFIPDARALRQPLSAGEKSWTPTAERPITRYAPAYAKRFASLDPQIAWFTRGDSASVVVAFEPGARDTVFTADSLRAAVVISRSPSDPAVAQITRGPRRNALVLGVPRAPALVSVEVADSGGLAFGRARLAIEPAADSGISDILLFDGAAGLPNDFSAAVGRALGSLTVSRQTPFGLYWELYGALASSQSVSYNVTVERIGTGWLRRVAERVRLADRPQPVRVGFEDHPGARAAASGRSLLVDVSHIPPGRYRLTLIVRAGGRSTTRARVIDVW